MSHELRIGHEEHFEKGCNNAFKVADKKSAIFAFGVCGLKRGARLEKNHGSKSNCAGGSGKLSSTHDFCR